MVHALRPAILTGALALLAGCVGLGPTTTPNWQEHVAIAVPAADGAVDFRSAAGWLPDKQGYARNTSDFIAGGPNIHVGVFAMTQTSIMFMEWESGRQRYNIAYRMPYADILGARVESHGRGRRLVVTAKDYRTQTFEITGPNGGLIDQRATEQASELLLARIQAR